MRILYHGGMVNIYPNVNKYIFCNVRDLLMSERDLCFYLLRIHTSFECKLEAFFKQFSSCSLEIGL